MTQDTHEDFFEKYLKVVSDKRSCLNVNLDPALSRQRKSHVIPSRFVSDGDERSIQEFCFEIIEQVGDYCCSIKPNTQYFLGAYNILKGIVRKIHDEGMLAILDHKLSDIGPTNESAIFWMAEMKVDAFTYSPFPGNIQETVIKSHQRGLGVIVLTLMSNPEAEDQMVRAVVDGVPYYLNIARRVADSHADGCVIGLTGFVKGEYVENIQEIVGDQVVLLLQGIGPQGGETSKIKFVKNPLISLGREIIYSDNPKQAIIEYYERLDRLTSLSFR